jgi:hypothetical protein
MKINANEIAKAAGTNPKDTLLLCEYVIKTASPLDLGEPLDWVLGDTWISQNALPLATTEAGMLCWNMPAGLREYLESIGAIPKSANIVEVGIPKSRMYPDASIAKKIRDDASMRDKTVIPYFVTADTLNPIMTPKQSIDFNSKDFIRRNCDDAWNMAPGEITKSSDEIADILSNLRSRFPASRKVWAKFAPAAGGGAKQFDINDANEIKKWINSFFRDCYAGRGVTDTNIIETRPIVLELDISELPEVKRIRGNYGIQGLVGNNGVQYAGTTRQIVESGEWNGAENLSSIKENEDEAALYMTAIPIFKKFQFLGYRGWMGIDAIVAETKSGQSKVFVIEANCRITSATPLLALSGTVTANKSCRLQSFHTEGFNPIEILERKGLLYRGGEGVLPFMIDAYPNSSYPANQTKVRAVFVAKNRRNLNILAKIINQTRAK